MTSSKNPTFDTRLEWPSEEDRSTVTSTLGILARQAAVGVSGDGNKRTGKRRVEYSGSKRRWRLTLAAALHGQYQW